MAIFTRHRAIGRRSTLRLRVAAGVPALAGALLSILAPGHAHAQTTYIKENTTTLLNGADWSPTWAVTDTTGLMTFNNTLSASNAANLTITSGTFGRLVFSDNAPVTISSGTITLRDASVSVNMSGAGSDVTINSRFVPFQTPSDLNVSSGRTLTLGGGGTISRTLTAGRVIYSNGSWGSNGNTRWGAGSADAETGGVIISNSASLNFGTGAVNINGFARLTGSNASIMAPSSSAVKRVGEGGNVGKLMISSGTLSVTGSQGFVIGQGDTANSRGTLDINGGTFNQSDSGVGQGALGIVDASGNGKNASGTFRMSSGTAIVRGIAFGTGVTTTGTGVLTLNGGRLEIGTFGITSSGSGGFAYDITLSSGTVGMIATSWSSSLNMKLGNSPTFDTFKNGTPYTINLSGQLSNSGSTAGGLVKTGPGTLILSGSNTFSGATTIAAGSLALGVNGSLANSSMIVVGNAASSGATLDLTAKTAAFSLGAGQTLTGGGTVLVAPGQQFQVLGTFSPGNSPGLFTFDSGTTVLAGTTVMEVSGTARATSPSHGSGFYDAVNIVDNGTLQLGGGLALEFASLFADDTAFSLFTPASGSSLTGNFTGVTVTGGFYTGLTWNQTGAVWKSSNTAGGQSLEFSSATGQLVIVPEPATIGASAAGIAILALRAWRRRSR